MKITILGSGPAGYVSALKSAQLGAEVCVIEENEVGGTCLNWGCIPTKSLTASIEMLHKARNVEDYGLELKGEVVANLTKIMARKDRVVSTMVKGIRSLFKSANVSVIEGRGSLKSEREVLVTKKDGSQERIETDKIVIATGSKPAEIPLFPFDGKFILSSTDALSINEIPKRLIIIGAGVIGCEFACIFRELGSDVTMLELMPRPVMTEDVEIAEILERELKK
ncbi:MAG: FAD-dependent oxidoreductase, partial [Thermodesulfovibrionales bacterium]|nr:FAD-dependent oxidoreductase [Thermodesulfovibrionales bacterium]